MPDINRLIPDIYEVIKGNGGWTPTVTKFFSEELSRVAQEKFAEAAQPRNNLRLSVMGTPCHRKLWYRQNRSEEAIELTAEALGTFFYGDLLESFILALAKAAGHDVQGEQDELEVLGIKGHRDAVIDGRTVDVKSASAFGFEKFRKNSLREADPFGYLSQGSSYVYAGKDDPLVTDKKHISFLAVRKDRFKLCLDTYDVTEEMKNKEKEFDQIKKDVSLDQPPPRAFKAVPQGKSGNTKLDLPCQYCEFKKICWPEARVFLYSTGTEYLVDVNKEPRVTELIE